MNNHSLNKYKNSRFFVLQGEKGTGKTSAALERATYLQNQYCLYQSDNILIVTNNDKEQILNRFNEYKNSSSNLSLFSLLDNGFEVMNIEELTNNFYKNYTRKAQSYNIITSKEEKIQLLKEVAFSLKTKFPKSKILTEGNLEFLLNEIEYIKSNIIETLEEYQNFVRKGRVKKLPKNSKTREVIYNLLQNYNNKLTDNNFKDSFDIEKLSNCNDEKIDKKKYSHIIIDNSEILSKSQLLFIKSIFKNLPYSNFIIIVNTDGETNELSYFKGNKSIKNLDIDNKYKVINYKKHTVLNLNVGNDIINKAVEEEKQVINTNVQLGEGLMETEAVDKKIEKKSDIDLFMDYFDYCDLKHNKSYSFAVDTSNVNEIILNPNEENEVISEEELKQVPVYSDIAAGEPILISDEFEGTFNIPNYWLKGVKDAFMLRVKGDSMIGANIHHGDYVLIRKQSIANNKDIVAVDLDGNATLKRLSIEKSGIFLKPENPKYDPIKVQSEGAMIIGTAIGVIKRR